MDTRKHDKQVRKEYLEALEDGNLELASRIRKANPDCFISSDEGNQG